MYIKQTSNDAAEVILWLHGSLVSGWMWEEQLQRLPQYDHWVPDLPGIGHSGEQVWTSLPETATALLAAWDAQGDKRPAHVVGISLGSLVALHMLSQAPSTFASALLSGALTRPISKRLQALQRWVLFFYHMRWSASLVAAMLGLPEVAKRAFLETAYKTPKESNERSMQELTNPFLPDLGSIQTRILAVAGSKDSSHTHVGLRDLVEQCPRVEARVVEGMGHQWPAEDGVLFARMVQAWLQKEPLPEALTRPEWLLDGATKPV